MQYKLSKKKKTYINILTVLLLSVVLITIGWVSSPAESKASTHNNILAFSSDSPEVELPFPFKDDYGDPNNNNDGGLYLNDPSNVQSGFEYDPETDSYNYYEKIGDMNYKYPSYMDFEEYLEYDADKALTDYWQQKAAADDINQTKGFRPQIKVKGEAFDRLFGGNTIDIRPQGSAELSFGVNVSRRDNPALPERQRRTTTFDFNQKIQLNVIGHIGEKLKITTSYNTEATFDFENQMKIEYTGYEDEIIQKIEAGNVSLPLKGTLITGSQTLFGIKTKLQFGRLSVTSVLSQEKGEKKEIEIQGGAQIKDYELSASDYEDNKHYFISHFFRNDYERALQNPPIVNSRVNITKMEIWVANVNNSIENTRNIIGFMDLGEASNATIYNNTLVLDNNPVPTAIYPDNNANNLYKNITSLYPTAGDIRSFVSSSQALEAIGYVNGTDFEKYENARLLSPTEYTYNSQLGYISLNTTLNPDDILAVSFQYTVDGQVYQVGEFSTDGVAGQDALYVKLLKGSTISTQLPTWDLMMKNVYSLGAYNIAQNDFFLNVWYLNPATGVEIPFIPEGVVNGKPLVSVLNLDRVNSLNQSQPDGVFDFISGLTINPTNGRVYFPVLEPFGSHLRNKLVNTQLADKYAFDSLYTTTKILAKQDANKDRYTIKGQYSSSSSSDISLNAMNIPEGSVVVTAGGATLTENVDYTVDYNLGRVKIINDGLLQSGTPIKISLESNSLFNIQTKTLMGSRLDYVFNDNFSVGGTILNLTEKPLTRKINIGDEPISNTIWGLDGTYSTKLPFLTRLVDKLPIYSTKEPSSMTVEGEFAHLIPGNARAISKDGISYLDDFEGSQSLIDLKTVTQWSLASTPQGQPDIFPEGDLLDDRAYGYNRSKLAWYVIDPLFWRDDNRTPAHIKSDNAMQSNHYMREVLETEVYPNKDVSGGVVTNIPVLDLAYYPTERGPYNYDDGTTAYGAGLDASGKLNNPSSRWAGITRKIETTDFESSNVEFIQFWVMDPFNSDDGDPNHPGGQLYFNLGNISEDILKDSRKSFENGLPTSATVTNVDTTIWGRVPNVQVLVNAFDNTPSTRPFQDVGLDGLNDNDEAAFFNNYVNTYGGLVSNDPSADNFHYFRGSDYDTQKLNILDRYKFYNGLDGNSNTSEQSPESYTTSATTLPNTEDLNLNNNLDFRESYYQYVVNINPTDVSPTNVGNNYITDVLQTTVGTPDGRTRTINWYQFKIPIKEPDRVVGDIQDYKSIRYMRMFMKGFSKEVVLRFASLDLVRGEWRKYFGSLLSPGDYIGNDDDETDFIISAVNVEENSNKTPVNYIIPPDIQRELDPTPGSGGQLRQQNEQALVLDVCDLVDGDARAAFKTMDIDIRQYKKLKMFIHAEESDPVKPLYDKDVSVFIRIGTDFNDNYYEYEVPLVVTPPGSYNTNSETDQRIVWPDANSIDLAFSKFTEMKKARNKLITSDPSVSVIKPYEKKDGKNIMRIKGNPNFANVRVFMIGVRNPKQDPNASGDDGLAKCAEIWVNELRLSDFDNSGGWATIGRVNTKVADLGTVTLAGNYSTPGFGSIEQKLNERQQETRKQYDLSTNVELGKFVPEKVGVSIPMYYNVSEGKVTPRYNPLDPDLELKDLLNDSELPKEYRDSIGQRTEQYTKRRSINFTNVRKLKPKGRKKSRFYDVSNFSFTYGYSETFYRDIDTEFDFKKNYKGGVAYSFSNTPKNYTPFAKAKFASPKALTLVRDFNFYIAPKQLTFMTDMDRMYAERQSRNNTGFDFSLPTYYQKHFYWNRSYGYKHDLSKSLKFDFSAINNASIYEPLTANGRVSKDYEEEYNQWQDTVWQSIREFGTNTHYHHNFNINYNVPITKIPPLDWITLTARYSGDYDWQRAPIGADSLGHTIQNANSLSFNGQLNMTKFYYKVKFLKEVDKRQKLKERRRAQKKNAQGKPQTEIAKIDGWKEGSPPENLDFELKKFKDKEGVKIEMWRKKEPKHPFDPFWIAMMSVKNISGTYTKTRGTMLPGYRYETYMMGHNASFEAPGFNFISGIQEEDFAVQAADRDWLVDQSSLMYNYTNSFSENYNFNATIRPVKTLRIQLSATRNYGENLTQQFFAIGPTFVDTLNGTSRNGYYFPTPTVTGNFSMSYWAFNTAFVKDNEDDYSSTVFENLLEMRKEISQRVGDNNPNSNGTTFDGYADGFGGTSQDVLIPTFMAAYRGQSANDVSLNSFKKLIPLPNWRVTYDGLSKLALIDKVFKKFTITHAYKSTFNVSSFTTNLLYTSDKDGNATARDINANFIPEYQISSASISEQFSPLMGYDMTLKNDMLLRVEFKRDRNASLSLSNNQITEVKGREFLVGTGYKFRQVRLPISKRREIRSDIDLRADFSIRNNKTIIRKIVEQVNQLTGGQKILSIKFTADYRISRALNLRAFYDKVITNPFISNSFPTANTNVGISLRFTLSQ